MAGLWSEKKTLQPVWIRTMNSSSNVKHSYHQATQAYKLLNIFRKTTAFFGFLHMIDEELQMRGGTEDNFSHFSKKTYVATPY